jgi:hypothetical protein
MDELTDAGTEAARLALAAERLRSARVLGLLRFVGISIACALNLLLPEVLHETRALQADIRLFACYWLVAAAVFWRTVALYESRSSSASTSPSSTCRSSSCCSGTWSREIPASQPRRCGAWSSTCCSSWPQPSRSRPGGSSWCRVIPWPPEPLRSLAARTVRAYLRMEDWWHERGLPRPNGRTHHG